MHRQLTNLQEAENIVIIGSGLVGLDANLWSDGNRKECFNC